MAQLEQMRVLRPNLEKAMELFPDNQVLAQVTGDNKGKVLIPARQAWRAAGVPGYHADEILNGTGFRYDKLLLDPQELDNLLLERDPEKFIQALTRIFTPLYNPVQPFLDANGYKPEHGFHSHTLEHHILPMVRIALELLKERNVSIEVRNRVILALFLHDIGNSLSRSLHALLLPYMLPLLFQTAELPGGSIGEAILAAVTHDEKTGALPMIEVLIEKAGCKHGYTITEEKALELQAAFDTTFTEDQCWLWLLDKAHFDRRRINNTREVRSDAMVADAHFLATVGHKVGHIGMAQNETFEMRYDFSLFGENTIPENIKLYKVGDDQRLRIEYPKTVTEKVKENGTSYFAHSVEIALGLYKKRWLLAALSAFKLYGEEVQRVCLVFRNTDIIIGGTPAQERSYCWTRAEVWQELLVTKD